MKKEDLLIDEFLKQFKKGAELNDFLKQIQKRGIEKMLEGELDDHVGYDKNQPTTHTNSRNGYPRKRFVPPLENLKFKCPEIEMLPLIQ